MPDVRTIDLEGPADSSQEVRLQLHDCVVSLWLPAAASTMGKTMKALADIGYDVPRSSLEENQTPANQLELDP